VPPMMSSRMTGGKRGSCPFCSHLATGRREPVLCEKDGACKKDSEVELISAWGEACAFCHLARHLERFEIDFEAILIWLPEVTQRALNRIAWQIYRWLAQHGAAFDAQKEDAALVGPAARAAALRRALIACSADAAQELGTNRPSELAQALWRLSPRALEQGPQGLGGIRLFPLGQLFIDGRDIFPALCREREGCSVPRASKLD